jgi:hypothetical protein
MNYPDSIHPMQRPRPDLPVETTDTASMGYRVSKPEEFGKTTIPKILESIRSDAYKHKIEVIRQASDIDKARKLKTALPWFSLCRFVSSRKNSHLTQANGMILDYDLKDESEIPSFVIPAQAGAEDLCARRILNKDDATDVAEDLSNPAHQPSATELRIMNYELKKESNPALHPDGEGRCPSTPEGHPEPVEGCMVRQAHHDNVGARLTSARGGDEPHHSDPSRLCVKRMQYVEYLKREVLSKLDWVRFAFTSPSGGLKVGIQFKQPLFREPDYKMVYLYIQEFADNLLGLKSDATPDPARATFFSWDPALYDNPDARQIDTENVLKQCIAREVDTVARQESAAQLRIKNYESKESSNPALHPSCGASPQTPSDSSLRSFAPSRFCAEKTKIVITEQVLKDVDDCIGFLSRIKTRYHDWIKVGMALYAGFGESGKKYWDRFFNNPHYYYETQNNLDTHWKSFSQVKNISLASLFYVAEQYGWINPNSPHPPASQGYGDPENPPSPPATELRIKNYELKKESNPAHQPSATELRIKNYESNELSNPALHPDGEGRCPSTPEGHPEPVEGCMVRPAHHDNVGAELTSARGGDELHRCVPLRLGVEKTGSELVELFGKPANVELDIDMLPETLIEYLAFTDSVTDAQLGAKLTAFLPCIAANIGNRVYMVNNSARIFPHIWAIIIGPSSISRKTTVIKLAKQTLEPYEESLNEQTADDYLKNTLIMTDVTMSKLLQMLSENPNRVFIQMEVSAWMRQMNRHWNAGMKQALTDLFDGVDKTIANMDRTERIRKPAFSIIAASTEGWFYQEMKEVADQQSGFMQRFLFSLIQNVNVNEIDLTYREGQESCPELRQYEEIFSVFRSIPGHFKLGMDEEAKNLRNEKYKSKFEVIANLKNDALMSYFARIYDGYFFKFCIIFHLLKNWKGLRDAINDSHPREGGDPGSATVGAVKENKSNPAHHPFNGASARIPDSIKRFFESNLVLPETVEQAFALCDYYYENTKPMLASLTENMKLQNERRLVSLLCRYPQGTATHSSLLNRSHLNKREFRDAIESLIDREAVTVTATHNQLNNKTAKTYILSAGLLQSWQADT